MKTAILYYSFGGRTKDAAEKMAAERGAALERIEEERNRSFFSAVIPGCIHARCRKASALKPLRLKLDDFERILIGAPIWGGFPAPAFNAAVELLPQGKEVELFFCSGGGSSSMSEEGTRKLIAGKKCSLMKYHDIKTGK